MEKTGAWSIYSYLDKTFNSCQEPKCYAVMFFTVCVCLCVCVILLLSSALGVTVGCGRGGN